MWIRIENFNYEINEKGVVRNTKFNNRLLKPYNNGNGYYHVDLQQMGKSFPSSIHSLLMRYFGIGDPKQHVNHKDGNPANNSLDNLEWATPSENHKHRYNILKSSPNRDKITGRWIKKEFPKEEDGK